MKRFEQKSEVYFSQKEISIIREMMFDPGIEQYLENTNTDKEYEEGNKILYKLGYEGINKDGTDNEDYSK